MMNVNWFKKMAKYFKDDSGHEEETETAQNHRTLNKNIDTRVVYQYPKNHFRFPVIPDQDALPARTSKKGLERPQPDLRAHQPITRYKREKIGQKGSHPFRPTDIPSPVYGYKRPENGPPLQQKEPVFEYELEDDYQKDIRICDIEKVTKQALDFEPVFGQNTAEAAPVTGLSAHGEKVQAFTGTDSISGTQSETSENLSGEKAAQKVQQREAAAMGRAAGTGSPDQILDPQTGEIAATTDPEAVFGTPGPLSVEGEAEIPQQGMMQDVSQTGTAAYTKGSSDALENSAGEQAFLEAGPSLQEETGGRTERQEHVIGKGTELLTAEKETEASGLVQPSETEQVKEEQQTASETEQVGAAAVETIEAQDVSGKTEEKPKKERKHLPFNVLMLNQDRRKIAAKKEAPRIQQEKPALGMAAQAENGREKPYAFPPLSLLDPPVKQTRDAEWINEQSETLDRALENFNVRAKVVNASQGPSVTRFEVQPEPGVKVNKITNLNDDLKLSLAAKDIRIEAPIPGKHTVGIEIPNVKSRPVRLSEIIGDPAFQNGPSPLTVAMGLDISGKPVVTDLQKMPHGLIAGATGSGKSVCINSILVSLLYKAAPHDLKLLLIDPKMVELAPYNNIPHLVSPVITDVKMATAALKWAVEEMERRYELFAHESVRDIHRFNQMAEQSRCFAEKLPYIVIVIDELADLMMTSPADVEDAICRIAQKARACGIHLIIATQRPSVDVITGLIKANIPTRIAFSVSSQVDSRTIIDTGGAEKLLGKGDMLFLENGSSKPVRLQGTFVSDREIDDVVLHARKMAKPEYLFKPEELMVQAQMNEEEDELFLDACEFVIEQGSASTSLLQRNFRIGYNRAARLVDMMEEQGIISEAKGSRPRDVLVSKSEFRQMQEAGAARE
ncbi:DNA translocase SftA [Weizmannia acidilactici]|nr:DNA translocase SftA [Weizmannia acidilactici]